MGQGAVAEPLYRGAPRAARVRRVLALLLLPALAGCAALDEPAPKALAGPTDGYSPTASFLKVHVKRDDGTVALLDFDRRDWYTAKIADLVDLKQMKFVSAQAKPREILNEYLALSVTDPAEVAKLRYDAMDATPEQRARMDAEYERLLEAWMARAPVQPTQLLPQDALP